MRKMRTEYDATLECPHCQADFTVHAAAAFYPGVHTLRNGDPGYPDQYDFDCSLGEGCAECKHQWTDAEVDALCRDAEQQIPSYDKGYDGPEDDDQ
jgi:hypothetical protein